MQADTIKLLFTYVIAFVIIAGGGLMLYATRLDPPETTAQLQLVIAGFMGAAITFVFSAESSTRATRAAASTSAAATAAALAVPEAKP
jgi:hypothetical protein